MRCRKIAAVLCTLTLLFNVSVTAQGAGSAATAGSSSESLTKITIKTFDDPDEISSIHIGSGVTSISHDAFVNMINLSSIEVSADNAAYSSYSGCLYDKNQTTLLCFPPALTAAYIPATVTSIGEDALDGVDSKMKKTIKRIIKSQSGDSASSTSGKSVLGAKRAAGSQSIAVTETGIVRPHFVHTTEGLKWDNSKGQVLDLQAGLMTEAGLLVADSTTAKMTQEEELAACYDALLASAELEDTTGIPLGNWTATYADDLLLTGKGDDYHYAAAFAYIAAGLGYKAKVAEGIYKNADGDMESHAWSEVYFGDVAYVFDPAMEEESGRNGYKLNSGNTSQRVRNATYTVAF